MCNSLYETISEIQNGDNEKIIDVINEFELTIKKFSIKLHYEEAETDLIIAFIEMIRSINLNKFDSDNKGAIVNYIYNTMKNKHVDLFRKHVQRRKEEVEINLDIIADTEEFNMESGIFMENLLSNLTNRERIIVKEKYIKDHSDIEIAEKLHITRQAVNKARNKALGKLRTYLGLNFSVA